MSYHCPECGEEPCQCLAADKRVMPHVIVCPRCGHKPCHCSTMTKKTTNTVDNTGGSEPFFFGSKEAVDKLEGMQAYRGAMTMIENPQMLKADGFDSCILGYVERAGSAPYLIYDTEKIVNQLWVESDMTREEAVEYFNFNIVSAWVGEGTPGFLYMLEVES